MAPHNLANPPTLMNMTTTSGSDGMSLPMGMSMPPMGIPGMPSSDATVELTHMHRMNPLMNSAPIFPGVGTGRLSTMPTIPSIPTGTSSSKSQSKATAPVNANSDNSKSSKKRKAPSAISAVSTPDIDDDDKTGYEDPKAKRRAQIAKAARKHRQRQKDELIALRAKVKDLKEQIEVLQSSEPSEHNTEMGWKQEAEQHAAMRARVDQENEFLRKTLMEQMKFIQRLQDYFTKQPLLNVSVHHTDNDLTAH
jgi:hypothetical protein